jgi:hypothetical protein
MKKKPTKSDNRRAAARDTDASHPQIPLALQFRMPAVVLAFPRKESTKRLSQQDALKRVLDFAGSFRRG